MTCPLFVILFIDLNHFFLSDYASEATTHASEATTHAGEATTHASEATTYAIEATTHASEAITHASEATTHASEDSGWPPSLDRPPLRFSSRIDLIIKIYHFWKWAGINILWVDYDMSGL